MRGRGEVAASAECSPSGVSGAPALEFNQDRYGEVIMRGGEAQVPHGKRMKTDSRASAFRYIRRRRRRRLRDDLAGGSAVSRSGEDRGKEDFVLAKERLVGGSAVRRCASNRVVSPSRRTLSRAKSRSRSTRPTPESRARWCGDVFFFFLIISRSDRPLRFFAERKFKPSYVGK